MCDLLPLQSRPPRHENTRAEDDQEAAGDDYAAVGKCGHRYSAYSLGRRVGRLLGLGDDR
jgi:hypothetical protein